MIKDQPITVEVTRGTRVESRHRVHAVVVDAAGTVVHAWGQPDLEIYPRSAIKPLQALALIETGAATHYDFSEAEIALACASHSGEPGHIEAVSAVLARIDCGESDLKCGAHWPYNEEAVREMARQGETPCRLHNNCSGKHSGFLATARHLGEDLSGYLEIDHPVQKRLYDALCDMGDCELSGTGRGIDGCGIPVYGMPLSAMALGLARMADPSKLGPARKAAAERIVTAMAAHPFLVAGSGRFDTIAMQAGAGAFACKGGAEGVHAVILPGLGLGVALKTEDGTARAADAVTASILDFLGILDGSSKEVIGRYSELPIPNAAGDLAGHVRTHAGWAE